MELGGEIAHLGEEMRAALAAELKFPRPLHIEEDTTASAPNRAVFRCPE